MTKRLCPWCGGESLLYTGSNTLQDTRPGDHPYYVGVEYWEDRECGYREVTTKDGEVLRFHKPRPPLPISKQPEYLIKGKK